MKRPLEQASKLVTLATKIAPENPGFGVSLGCLWGVFGAGFISFRSSPVGLYSKSFIQLGGVSSKG